MLPQYAVWHTFLFLEQQETKKTSLYTGIKPPLPGYVLVLGLVLRLKNNHLLTEEGIHEPLVCS